MYQFRMLLKNLDIHHTNAWRPVYCFPFSDCLFLPWYMNSFHVSIVSIQILSQVLPFALMVLCMLTLFINFFYLQRLCLSIINTHFFFY